MRPRETDIGGRYRLEELLGRGGMSEVWRARDLELGRTVALKLLAPTAEVERFRREARAVASLSHENVTQVYDYGEDAGRPYMVFEYLPGGTLDERLRDRGPLPLAAVTAIASGIAAGLAHAHARGLVHRDLKPANVLFDSEGRPKIADFGIARLGAGASTLTEGGTVLGTAAYISPEQATGRPAGPPSDVYSFGVLLYRMLAERLPFESDDPLELVALHRDATPPPVESLREDTPPALAALTAATLAKDPALRPRDGGALLATLGGTPEPQETATAVLPALDAIPRRHRARRLALGLVALVVLLTAGGILAWAVTRPAAGPALAPSTSGDSLTLPKGATAGTTAAASTSTAARTASTSTAATTTPTATHARTTVHTTTAPTIATPPVTTPTTAPTTAPTVTTPTVTTPTTATTAPATAVIPATTT